MRSHREEPLLVSDREEPFLVSDETYSSLASHNDLKSSTRKYQASRACHIVYVLALIGVFVIALLIGHRLATVGSNNNAGANGTHAQVVPEWTTTIIISIDGLRASFIDEYSSYMPNIIALRSHEQALCAEQMISVLPTTTFPNHNSIITGLYPSKHGIVSNKIYDYVLNATFDMQTTSKGWWKGEPFWKTLERNNINSASMFWPGNNVSGNAAPVYIAYDGQVPANTRSTQLLTWIDQDKEQKTRFYTLYFEMVDSAAHSYGTKSTQLIAAIKTVDAAIALLIKGLRSRNLYENVSIVIVSDHGHADTDPLNRSVYLDSFTDISKIAEMDAGAFLTIWPKSCQLLGREAQCMKDTLSIYQDIVIMPHSSIFMRENIPSIYQYTGAPNRIAPIVGVADDGWLIGMNSSHPYNNGRAGATHGYAPDLASMAATFIAKSPMLSGGLMYSIANVNVYSLLCYLTGLTQAQCAKTDGSLQPFVPYLLKNVS